MKNKLFLFAILLVINFAAFGQRRQADPAKMAEQQTVKLQEKFTELEIPMDDATYEKVKALNLKYAEKGKTLRDEHKGDREAMRAAVQTMGAERRKEMKALLSKEQFKAYKKVQEEMREERRGRMGERPE